MACLRDGFEPNKLLDNRFLTISALNHGSFGLVFRARDTLTGQDVAIKCITKPNAVEQSQCPATYATDDHSQELEIHSKLPYHENIVNLVHSFETENHQYIVIELCSNGDLYEAIRVGKGPLETEHVRDFMLQLIDSIDHLHSNGVYHRDLKPENIFLTSSGSMKLGDFGLATTETWSTEFAVGSDRYMAPEQYDASVYGYGYSPAAADVWAIGIVLLNVLFQRNPFAFPTNKDPLFSDFAADRQNLFDVFPNMSQDTFNVIRHSLALDPANRSLSAVREALESVLSFTTDDESLDDFCTESPHLAPLATHAREPLRTPSISTPVFSGDSFPWHQALHTTPQIAVRQLSTINDNESEMFPGSVQSNKWRYGDADEASLSSNRDSGLGMSYKSSQSIIPKLSNNFVGSLPISFTRKTSSPYGGTNPFSKSWSDLWDEEEELAREGRSSLELGMDISRVSTAKPSGPQLAAIMEDGRGSVTPRQANAVLASTAPSGTTSPITQEQKPEMPKQRSSSILDRWSVLGNFRRAKQHDVAPTPVIPAVPEPIAEEPVDTAPVPVTPTPSQKNKYTDALSNFTPFGNSAKKTKPKTRERSGSWRQGTTPVSSRLRSASTSRNWDRKERDQSPSQAPPVPTIPESWSLDNNWRDHKPRVSATKTNAFPTDVSMPLRSRGSQPRTSSQFDLFMDEKELELFMPAFDDSDGDDIDLMVGGWHSDVHV
jgi:serine/threonine protein kinase